MKYFLSLFVLLAAASAPLSAADKPNTLTAKEIADGWILLFDGETTFGWTAEGQAKVVDGRLVVGDGKAAAVQRPLSFGDCELQIESRGAAQLVLQAGPNKTALGLTDQNSVLLLSVKNHTGRGQSIESTSEVGNDGVRRDKATFLHDNSAPLTLRFEVADGGSLALRRVSLKPGGLKSIFDGKDLSGWKEVKTNRTKSKFTVTEAGELRVQDGPGDLQTESQWDDFVLQIEVFSNGDHLNSGVFFRCQPDKFWSGYEAQIRNQWQGDDRTKAVDYGTGGIYNRQPARKVVSSDREWFTMTVVASGPHLAVWVNGYQTADYTDKRPANASARQGTKVDKGPISLQGHDPTTDLRFRNIRIAELPKAGRQGADKGTPSPAAVAQNKDLRRLLLRLREEDQAARFKLIEGAKKQGASPQSDSPALKEMAEIDKRNMAQLKAIIELYGWPGKSLVGQDGAAAAWLLVQHAVGDHQFMERCLGLMKAAAKGEVEVQHVAYLTDRVRIMKTEKQLYGTQIREEGGEFVALPIEDEANVDKRRAEVGLMPLAEYLKFSKQVYKGTAKNESKK